MRLAVFTSKYPARVATFFERDLRGLRAAGVELKIFPIHPLDPSLWKYSQDTLDEGLIREDDVHHLTLRRALARALRRPPRPKGFVRDAARLLAAASRFGAVPLAKTVYVVPKAWTWAGDELGPFDHVLAYWGNFTGSCAYLYHRLMGAEIPFSIWLHAGTDLYRDRVFLREKLLYADRIITCIRFNTEFLKETYPDIWSVLEPKLHVHYHGLDVDTFGYDPSGRPPARVLAVGRFDREKGFHHVIQAAAILVESGRELEVELVGDGDAADDLRELARELGIANRVTFSGWLPVGQVREAMCRATVLAHPSTELGDGLPNVIREAMALGTPVVATRIAGIPEALEDGCGVLVPPQDPGALAQALGELLDDPKRRRRFADAARKRTESQYDQWANGRALAAVLKSTTRHSSMAASDR